MPFGNPAMRRILNEWELFSDKKYFQRDEVIKRVIERWRDLTGEQLDKKKTADAFKRCMRNPEFIPLVPLGGYGKYEYVPDRADITAQPIQSRPRGDVPQVNRNKQRVSDISTSKSRPFSHRESELPAPPARVRQQWSDDGPAKRNLGEGHFRVYAWCWEHDANANQNQWPIKVGICGAGGLRARLDRTQMSEPPLYLLCIRFQSESDAKNMEKALHICLHFRSRRCAKSLGTEWFSTNPQELVDLAREINPSITEWKTEPTPSW